MPILYALLSTFNAVLNCGNSTECFSSAKHFYTLFYTVHYELIGEGKIDGEKDICPSKSIS